jgi:hypothetical protein
MVLTGLTQPADTQVMQIRGKPITGVQLLFDGHQQGRVCPHYPAALAADEVEMRTVLVRRVHDPAVPQVRAADKAHIHQQIESAVNGGEVQRFTAHMDCGEDFLSGHVMIAMRDRIHDHLPLRGDPVTALAKFIKESVTMGHCEHPLLQLFATDYTKNCPIYISPTDNKKGQDICLPSKKIQKLK